MGILKWNQKIKMNEHFNQIYSAFASSVFYIRKYINKYNKAHHLTFLELKKASVTKENMQNVFSYVLKTHEKHIYVSHIFFICSGTTIQNICFRLTNKFSIQVN